MRSRRVLGVVTVGEACKWGGVGAAAALPAWSAIGSGPAMVVCAGMFCGLALAIGCALRASLPGGRVCGAS
jgi:hypothetical protein